MTESSLIPAAIADSQSSCTSYGKGDSMVAGPRETQPVASCSSPSSMTTLESSPARIDPPKNLEAVPTSLQIYDSRPKPRWSRPQSAGKPHGLVFEFAPLWTSRPEGIQRPSRAGRGKPKPFSLPVTPMAVEHAKFQQPIVDPVATVRNTSTASKTLPVPENDVSGHPRSGSEVIIAGKDDAFVHVAAPARVVEGTRNPQTNHDPPEVWKDQGGENPKHAQPVATRLHASLAISKPTKVTDRSSPVPVADYSNTDAQNATILLPETDSLVSELPVILQTESRLATGSQPQAIAGDFPASKSHENETLSAPAVAVPGIDASANRHTNHNTKSCHPSEEDLLQLLMHRQRLKHAQDFQTRKQRNALKLELSSLKLDFDSKSRECDEALGYCEKMNSINKKQCEEISAFRSRYLKLKNWALEVNQEFTDLLQQGQHLRKDTAALTAEQVKNVTWIKDLKTLQQRLLQETSTHKVTISELKQSHRSIEKTLHDRETLLASVRSELNAERLFRKKLETYFEDLRNRQEATGNRIDKQYDMVIENMQMQTKRLPSLEDLTQVRSALTECSDILHNITSENSPGNSAASDLQENIKALTKFVTKSLATVLTREDTPGFFTASLAESDILQNLLQAVKEITQLLDQNRNQRESHVRLEEQLKAANTLQHSLGRDKQDALARIQKLETAQRKLVENATQSVITSTAAIDRVLESIQSQISNLTNKCEASRDKEKQMEVKLKESNDKISKLTEQIQNNADLRAIETFEADGKLQLAYHGFLDELELHDAQFSHELEHRQQEAATSKAQLAKYQGVEEELRQEIQQLQSRWWNSNETIVDLRKELAKVEQANAKNSKQLLETKAATRELLDLRSHVEDKEKTISGLQATLSSLRCVAERVPELQKSNDALEARLALLVTDLATAQDQAKSIEQWRAVAAAKENQIEILEARLQELHRLSDRFEVEQREAGHLETMTEARQQGTSGAAKREGKFIQIHESVSAAVPCRNLSKSAGSTTDMLTGTLAVSTLPMMSPGIEGHEEQSANERDRTTDFMNDTFTRTIDPRLIVLRMSPKLMPVVGRPETAGSHCSIVPDSQQTHPHEVTLAETQVSEPDSSSSLTELSEPDADFENMMTDEMKKTISTHEPELDKRCIQVSDQSTCSTRFQSHSNQGPLESPARPTTAASQESMLLHDTPKAVLGRPNVNNAATPFGRDALTSLCGSARNVGLPQSNKLQVGKRNLGSIVADPTSGQDTTHLQSSSTHSPDRHHPNSAIKRKREVEAPLSMPPSKRLRRNPGVLNLRQPSSQRNTTSQQSQHAVDERQAVKPPAGNWTGGIMNSHAPAPSRVPRKSQYNRKQSRADRYAERFNAHGHED